MSVTAIADIIASMESEIALEYPTYGELAYKEDVAKNSSNTIDEKYGVRALAASQLPGVTKNVTLNQEFEVILTKKYNQAIVDDSSQRSVAEDLRAKHLCIYKRLINGKAGLPGTVLNVTDLILSEPEYGADDKVVIQRASMNIQYRFSLI